MKYLILVYGNPTTRELWASFSREDRAEGLRAHAALEAGLAASGELVISEALADPAQGRRINTGDGPDLSTDGPFAETKEYLAGFYLVDCPSFERAVELAERVPEASFGMVEVRPVVQLDDLLG